MAVLTDRFGEALRWANELHRHQSRKGGSIPYVSHVLAVASLVLEDGGDEDTAIAALLHDAIEDCGLKPEDIELRFGPAVRAMVVACTDSDQVAKAPWRIRKERALAQLGAAGIDPRALRVAAADKLHNVTSLLTDLEEDGPRVWTRFRASPADTLWYYEQMHHTISARLTESRLPNRLAAAIERLRTQGAQ